MRGETHRSERQQREKHTDATHDRADVAKPVSAMRLAVCVLLGLAVCALAGYWMH
jgi:hypothetical protein